MSITIITIVYFVSGFLSAYIFIKNVISEYGTIDKEGMMLAIMFIAGGFSSLAAVCIFYILPKIIEFIKLDVILIRLFKS